MNKLQSSLIVISSNLTWDWTTDYINQTAKYLCADNLVVCIFWFEATSIKEWLVNKSRLGLVNLEKGIIGYYPIFIIPFRRFIFVRKINMLLNIFFVCIAAGFLVLLRKYRRTILWNFSPHVWRYVKYFPKYFYKIYDCVDYYLGDIFYKEEEFLQQDEIELLKNSNVVFVNSRSLYDIHSKIRKDIILVPQGFRVDAFQKKYKIMNSEFTSKMPIIGYVGGINWRLDYRLLFAIAQRCKNYLFIYAGPIIETERMTSDQIINMNRLFSISNVKYIGRIDKKYISELINKFTVGMIPYDQKQKFNKYSYPMKLFEYFYMGKPVISTDIKELRQYSKYVKIAHTIQEWHETLNVLLSKPWPESMRKEQRKIAKANSWENKLETICEFIDGHLIGSK